MKIKVKDPKDLKKYRWQDVAAVISVFAVMLGIPILSFAVVTIKENQKKSTLNSPRTTELQEQNSEQSSLKPAADAEKDNSTSSTSQQPSSNTQNQAYQDARAEEQYHRDQANKFAAEKAEINRCLSVRATADSNYDYIVSDAKSTYDYEWAKTEADQSLSNNLKWAIEDQLWADYLAAKQKALTDYRSYVSSRSCEPFR